MKMGELVRYDVPAQVIGLWQERESETLLPLQELTVKRHNLFGPGHLLLQAPTSSGKTFIGEMAAVHTAMRRKKVVYLVPLKALAEEKYLDFKEKYEPYGMRVIVSTRDHREFDAEFEGGNFSIAVAVYEKLAQLLVRRPERLEEIELLVADELEILSDPDRGPAIELLLTRVLASQCRVIGLSAVLGHAERLAEWMGADLVRHDRRPVELRHGVVHGGTFKYRTYNDCSEGQEPVLDVAGDSAWDVLMENVRCFAERGESCLVFVKARHESRRGAELLAQQLQLSPAHDAIAALEPLPATHSCDALRNTLRNGVAFHNADLSPDERRAVEGGFRRGEIKVLVSTSTLAAGMNLPAHNVFMAADKWQYDARFGMPWKTPILRSEYENMGGRAGRYGAVDGFGRSMLIAMTPFDEDTLWRRYVEGERERIEPQLHRQPLEDHIVRLVASRTCRTLEELQAFLERTLTGRWIWAETMTLEAVGLHVRAALNRAIDAGMLQSDPAGGLLTTPFGYAAASKGIGTATAKQLAHWIGESETRADWGALDAVLAAALTPDGRLLQVSLTADEYEQGDYPGALKRATRDIESTADVALNRLRNCATAPLFEEVRAIKAALVLIEWIEETQVFDIESRFHTLLGQIIAAADQIAWLIDATATLSVAMGARADFTKRLSLLAERVQSGLREETLPLARLRSPRLDRAAIGKLAAHGLHNPEALAATPVGVLTQWMTPADARELKKWAGIHTHAVAQGALESTGAPVSSTAAPLLVVDDRRPDCIHVDGMPVALQEKQYRLIRLLAERPGECYSYDTIYHVLWGEAVVEQNQLHFQKRKLLDCVKAVVPARAKLVRTIAKRGFVLELNPDQVQLIIQTKSSVA